MAILEQLKAAAAAAEGKSAEKAEKVKKEPQADWQINETKEKIDSAKQKVEEEKKKIDEDRKAYQEKLEAVNKKDKDLTEQQMALENGEYSSIVRALLDKMKETEHSIFEDTGNRIEELKAMHTAALSQIAEGQNLSALKMKNWNCRRPRGNLSVDRSVLKLNVSPLKKTLKKSISRNMIVN